MTNWLDSVYSDGTKMFVSNPTPNIGDTIELTIRFSADAPVKRVMVCSLPNGAEHYDEAKKVKEQGGLVYYTARVYINEYRIQYQFDLVTDDAIYFYTQAGITTYIQDRRHDFVLLTEYRQPDWVNGAVFYQIFPERFKNGNPACDVKSHEYEYMGYESIHMNSWNDKPLTYDEGHGVDFFGGDLYGIIQELDYLQELGVTALYLNPIFSSYSTHKYDCIDYYHVDEHFGGDEALAQLCTEVHNRGMHIILDISINHTGILHQWAREGRPYYFKNPDGSLQGWWNLPTLPVLDYRNDELRDLVYRGDDAVLRKWLRPPYSIDGWRFDVADVFARNNEVQLADELWKEICTAIRQENPDAFIIGEEWGDSSKYLQGDMWNTPMNYFGFARPIRQFIGVGDLFLERQEVFRDVSYKLSAKDVVGRTDEHYNVIPQVIADCQMNLFDSHDIARLHNYKHITFDSWKCAVIAQLLWTGIPCIYYGDEVGIDGYTWHDAGFRYPMPWDEVTKQDNKYLSTIKTMTSLRRGSKAFSHGGRKVLYSDGYILAVARFFDDEIYVGIISMEDVNTTISIPLDIVGAKQPKGYFDEFKKHMDWSMDNHMLSIQVEARSGYLFSCESA